MRRQYFKLRWFFFNLNFYFLGPIISRRIVVSFVIRRHSTEHRRSSAVWTPDNRQWWKWWWKLCLSEQTSRRGHFLPHFLFRRWRGVIRERERSSSRWEELLGEGGATVQQWLQPGLGACRSVWVSHMERRQRDICLGKLESVCVAHAVKSPRYIYRRHPFPVCQGRKVCTWAV